MYYNFVIFILLAKKYDKILYVKLISKVCRMYSDKSYQRNDKLSDEERKQIEEYASARQKEKNKTAVKETIKLIERLSAYGVDINTVSLRPIKDGEQITTI